MIARIAALTWCLFALPYLAGCAGPTKAAPHSLLLDLDVGTRFRVEMDIAQTIEMTLPGGELAPPTENRMGFTLLYEVRDVNPQGEMRVDVTYEAARMALHGSGEAIDFEYDSAKPPAVLPVPAVGIAAAVGNGFGLVLSERGEILALDGLDDLLGIMLRAIERQVGEAGLATEEMKAAMRKQFGETSMKEMFQTLFHIYPDRSVHVGDTWRKVHTITAAFPHVQSNTYKLVERGSARDLVEIKSKISPNPAGKPIDMGILKIGVSLRGTQRGSLELDRATGIVLEMDISLDLEGTMTPILAQKGAKEQRSKPMPIKLSGETRSRATRL